MNIFRVRYQWPQGSGHTVITARNKQEVVSFFACHYKHVRIVEIAKARATIALESSDKIKPRQEVSA